MTHTDVTPSLIKAAYDAARIYRDLKIVCPWCHGGVFGRDFAAHAGEHEQDRGPQISAVEQDCPGGCGGKCPASQSYCIPCFEGALFIDRNAIRLQRERADKAEADNARLTASLAAAEFSAAEWERVANGNKEIEINTARHLESRLAASEAGAAAMRMALSLAAANPVPYDHGIRGASFWHREPHDRPCVGCTVEDALAFDAGDSLLRTMGELRAEVTGARKQALAEAADYILAHGCAQPRDQPCMIITANAVRYLWRSDVSKAPTDVLKTLSSDELANFIPASDEQIEQALERGRLKAALAFPAPGANKGPVKTTYPLAADTLGPEEIAAAKAVLDSGKLTMGERVKQFEREFAAYVGSKHAIMVNSGSSANLLMVDAMVRNWNFRRRWEPGDEVIVPALAWPTTVWPLVQLGLVPVFVDVDPETLAIDLKSAESVLSPRTRGMFLIHVLGQAARVSRYLDFCRQHRLDLLEDCCESLGARTTGITANGDAFADIHIGNFGLAGSFSFYYSHHLSTIEGGMIVTNNDALNDNFRSLRAHGWSRDRSDREEWARVNPTIDERFLFVMPGYNVRPMEIQGAIGSVQLRKLDTMINARKTLATLVYTSPSLCAPWLHLIGNGVSTWMTLPFIVDESAPVSRDAVCTHLRERGVDTRPIIAGNLVRHPAVGLIEHRRAESLAVADRVFERGFMIGCHPILSDGARETLEKAIESLGDL